MSKYRKQPNMKAATHPIPVSNFVPKRDKYAKKTNNAYAYKKGKGFDPILDKKETLENKLFRVFIKFIYVMAAVYVILIALEFKMLLK